MAVCQDTPEDFRAHQLPSVSLPKSLQCGFSLNYSFESVISDYQDANSQVALHLKESAISIPIVNVTVKAEDVSLT